MIRAALVLALLFGLSTAAEAASFQVSYTDWLVRGTNVRLRVELPEAQARQTMAPGAPLTPEGIGDYVAAHVGARSAGGDCAAIDQGFDIGRIDPLTMANGRYRFEIFFQCPSRDGIVLADSMFFGAEPDHLDFAHVADDGAAAEKLFTRDRQSIAASGPSDGIWTFLEIGFAHVRHNWDHIFFLAGLVVLARRRRDLVLAGSGLAGGYVLSALIGLGGLVVPDMRAAEALSGLAILLLAIQALAVDARHIRPLAWGAFAALALIAIVPLAMGETTTALMLLGGGLCAASYAVLAARRANADGLRLIAPLLFALLDGLSFLPPTFGLAHATTMLAGFDVGAFLFQAVVLAVLFLAGRAAKALPVAWPVFALRQAATVLLCAVGVFWLASDYWTSGL